VGNKQGDFMRPDKEIATLCKKQRTITKRALSTQYDNTIKCQEFYNGDTMSYEDRIQFIDDFGNRRRALVQFNKVQPNVDAVVGFMAQNRRQAKYIARMNATDQQGLYSRYMNALYGFHRENTNADQLETDQDADMMINGYGAIETDLSYVVGNATTDPNGEIIKVRLDPRRVGWDATAKDRNLLSARWVYYWEDFDLKEALDLFQGSKQEDFEEVGDTQPNDAGYIYNPWGGLYDKIKAEDAVEWSSKEEDRVRVFNHQWMEYESFYRADNPLYQVKSPDDAAFIKMRLDMISSDIKAAQKANGLDGMELGDMFDFDPMAEILTFDEKTKSILMEEFGDQLEPVNFKRKVFFTAVMSGDHIFSKFRSVCQKGFSVQFKTGIYNEAGEFWTGMVNAMMQPAEYHNKALTELMFTIAANSKGGVMIEEDAVEDVEEFESKWAKTDAVIKVASGALSAGKIQEKTKAALPTGLENIITLSDASISANGVDPSFLGNISEEQQSGILFKRRIRQVISKMARYFDSITLYQKQDARICADLIRVWVQNNNGQWVRITGEDQKEDFMMVNEDKMAAEYDVSIQEASQSPEDKQETAVVLGTYADKLMMVDPLAGKAFYAESLQFLSIDDDVKNRLAKILQAQPGNQIDPAMVQQMQAELEQLKSEQNRAMVDKLKSETQLNLAKVPAESEKKNKVHADTAKTLEEAARTGLEADLIRSGSTQPAKVVI